MAIIRTPDGRSLTNPDEISKYLAPHGLEYARWGVERMPSGLGKLSLSDDEKKQVLGLYETELSDLRARRKYVTQDIVSLAPDNPKLEAILDVFRKEHYHTDDEVRFITAGRGVFYVRGAKGADAGKVIECEVHAGDLLVVPENTYHWFDLCAEKQIVAIRVFKTPEGWVANYKDAAPVNKAASGA